jgi:hypothetical protein
MAELSEIKARVRARLSTRQKDVELFTLRLQNFLRTRLRRILREIDGKDVTAQQAARVLGGLETAITEGGLDEHLGKLSQIHLDELRDAATRLRQASRGSDLLSGADLQTLEQLITFDTDQVGATVKQYVGDIKPIIMRQVIAGERFDLDSIQESLEPRALANIKTEIDTGVATFRRAVNFQKAEDVGIEWMLYVGPEDKITRDFCQEVLDGTLAGFERSAPIYTVSEIRDMDNGQGLPVSTAGGGYNCRHQWEVVLEEEAKSLLGKEYNRILNG